MNQSHDDLLRYSHRRITQRQLTELLGLCHGLIADRKIDQREAEALLAWLVNQSKDDQSVTSKLQDRVEQMLEDHIFDEDESRELMQLLQQVVTNFSLPKRLGGASSDDQTTALLGLCRGLIADGKIVAEEATLLQDWLTLSMNAINANPCIAALHQKLQDLRSSRILDIDSQMQRQLLKLVSGIVGGQNDVGECLRATDMWLDVPPPKIEFQGRAFCLTGNFVYGTRKQCEAVVRTKGGICKSALSGKVHYLVIGSYANEVWIQSAFGRKIEKALELRSAGGDLKIISEEHWASSLI